MAALESALVAACTALVAVYCTQFLAENYRRFKDGSALAAGLAGELASYEEAAPLLRVSLRNALENVEVGRQANLRFRPLEKPTDYFFSEVVGKVGLLGPALAEQVIYVYGNLNAFRSALVLINEKHQEMDAQEFKARLVLCTDALERAYGAGSTLIKALRARSAERFRPFR